MNAHDAKTPDWWQEDWVFAVAILAATCLAYQPVWHAGFLTDDTAYILQNPLVQHPDGWWRLWLQRAVDYVPATSLTFWLEWHLWATNPLGYHLDNVFLQSLDAVLIWLVLRKLKIPGAKLAALLFALHPVNVSSVAWITERKNVLAMAFYSGALLSYLVFEDTRRRRWYWIAAGAFLLGIFSKAAIAPLPVVLLGMAWWRRGRISSQDLRRSVLFFALAVAGGLLGILIQHAVNNSHAVRHVSFLGRLAGAGWIVWFYLGKALWPAHLIFIYPKWHIDASHPISYLPGLLVLAVFGLGWAYRRSWGKGLLFGFGYFVVMLVPVLGFVDISFMAATLVADHWQYFAVIGPIATVAAVLTILSANWSKILRSVLCGALMAGVGALTWKESRIYVNPAVFWESTLRRNPESFMAQSGYGNYLFVKGQVKEAIAHYQKALEIAPTFFDAHYDLGNIFLQVGQPAEAIFQFEKALEIEPNDVQSLNNLAWILATCPNATLRNGSKAIDLARQADELTGDRNPSILGTLAAARAENGQFPSAIAAVQRALQFLGTRNYRLTLDLQQQLDLYQRNLPYRDQSQVAPLPGIGP